ncbi:FAD-dependent oxidoreductase [Chloroflexota bacterium]
MSAENIVETDVLVIGGGMAGCFAAIKAREQGLDVTLVDKGYVSRSGSTPYPHSYAVFNPEWGHQLDDWMDYVNIAGEYVNNREWTEIVFRESYDRYQDLVSWGMKFRKNDNGELLKERMPSCACEALLVGSPTNRMEERKVTQVLRRQAIVSGVRIMDKIMVTDLIKQDEGVFGAIGISGDNYSLYVFKAKVTVVSTGAAGFKAAGWPIEELTGDGQAMAYRVGAEISGNEFLDTHSIKTDCPYDTLFSNRKEGRRVINAEGNNVMINSMRAKSDYPSIEFETHAGRAPISLVMDNAAADDPNRYIRVAGGAAGGMSIHTSEGIWPTNTKCASSLQGLYAAGDSCATLQVGAVYSAIGLALAGASVTGTRAGLGAAEYALQAERPIVDEEEISRLKRAALAATERKGGFSPRWVTQLFKNTLTPYFILFIKHEQRLQAALTMVEFMRDHLVPKLTAKDAHELRLAHETKNMVINAEMKLRTSLFRTESRGCHYREDYPRRDDPSWLAWVKLKEEQGKMELSKEPIPKEWWPDLSLPYEERYPVRFPGE